MVPPETSVGIVGAGVVARALGQLLHTRGWVVTGVASRSSERAEEAARFIGPGVPVVPLTELPRRAPLILIAVSDGGIHSVAEALAATLPETTNTVVLHTSGAVGLEAMSPLRRVGIPVGVIHPLQTVTSAEQGVHALVGVTFGVAGDPPAVERAKAMAERLEGQPLEIDAARLSAYHAGAVLASNAVVGVIDAALVLLEHAGIDPREGMFALGPLAFTTLENALTIGPKRALTGPVVRGDDDTVTAHVATMRDLPASIGELYQAVSRHLLVLARSRGLSEERVRAIEAALGGAPA